MSTVHLPDELGERLAAEATRRGISVDQVAAEALSVQFPEHRPEKTPRRLSFAGIGASGVGDIARRHKQVIAEDFADKTAADL